MLVLVFISMPELELELEALTASLIKLYPTKGEIIGDCCAENKIRK